MMRRETVNGVEAIIASVIDTSLIYMYTGQGWLSDNLRLDLFTFPNSFTM